MTNTFSPSISLSPPPPLSSNACQKHSVMHALSMRARFNLTLFTGQAARAERDYSESERFEGFSEREHLSPSRSHSLSLSLALSLSRALSPLLARSLSIISSLTWDRNAVCSAQEYGSAYLLTLFSFFPHKNGAIVVLLL